MDIWAMIQNYIDPVAVFVALLVTEIARKYVPGAAEAGKTLNRVLPLLPLAIGVIALGVQTEIFHPMGWVMKGLASGAFASYGYRVFKVVILGD